MLLNDQAKTSHSITCFQVLRKIFGLLFGTEKNYKKIICYYYSVTLRPLTLSEWLRWLAGPPPSGPPF